MSHSKHCHRSRSATVVAPARQLASCPQSARRRRARGRERAKECTASVLLYSTRALSLDDRSKVQVCTHPAPGKCRYSLAKAKLRSETLQCVYMCVHVCDLYPLSHPALPQLPLGVSHHLLCKQGNLLTLLRGKCASFLLYFL